MSCKDLHEAIALYGAGDTLEDDVRVRLDAHLDACPLCRARLAEFQTLQNDFRALASRSAPQIPADLLNSVRNAVAIEVSAAQKQQSDIFAEGIRRWLMPYTIATAASLILTFSLLVSLLSTRSAVTDLSLAAAETNTAGTNSMLLASNSSSMIDDLKITPSEYAAMRLPVANESPSVNPTGALVALTKSIVRGKMRDDEVVVVADVFGNGVAKISEVVEAPRNENDLKALEIALQKDPNDAAFLPAQLDKRSDVVRVVLKIQRVDVVEADDNKVTPKNKPKNR